MFVQNNTFQELDFDLVNASAPMGARDLAIFEDAKRTAPIGVEILEDCLNRSVVKLKDGNLDLVIMRMYIPKEKEASVQKWVGEFEDRHSIKLIIQRQSGYQGVQNLFNIAFKKDEVLTSKHIPDLDKIINRFFGVSPTISGIDDKRDLITELPDLSALPLIAIDDADTKDPEDAFCVEKLGEDIYRVTVAISDISWLIEPRGDMCHYAVNLGSTVYGSEDVISTLGTLSGDETTHLSYGKLSPAWVIRFDIEGEKRIKPAVDPFLANVVVHQNFVPKEMQGLCVPGTQFYDLMQAALLLKIQRSGRRSRKDFLRELRINPGLVTSEFMIRSKEMFASFLQRNKNREAIYKTQQNLSINKTRELVRTARRLGVDVRSDTFRNPILLSDFLTELQKSNFDMRIRTGHPNPDVEMISNEILNALLRRSHYDFHNRGHADLRLQSYCDIKGRLAAGIINQIQARSVYDTSIKPFNLTEIKKFTNQINRQMRNYGVKVFTLRFIEMLKEKLARVGEMFECRVVKTQGNTAFVEINGFKKWGVCNIPKDCEVDSIYSLRLKGYSLRYQRFLFE